MNEPRRLRQGGGPSQRLLDSASLDVPGPAARQRAVLLSSTAGVFSHTAGPARSAPRPRVARTLLTWASIGAAASLALVFVGTRIFDAHRGAQTAAAGAPLAELGAASSTAKPAADIAPEVLSPGVEPWVQAPALAAAPAEEGLALQRVREAVSRSDAATALRLLDDFDRRHPRTQLRAEGEALRVQSLFMGGRSTEARTRAEQFAQTYPEHPLAARLKRASR